MAAERRMIWSGAWFADPVYFGDYPEIMKQYIGDRLPVFSDEEKASLNGSSDFFGFNHYTTKWVMSIDSNTSWSYWAADQMNTDSECNQYNQTPIGRPADSDWLVAVPWGIYNVLKWIEDRYGNPPLYITENGCDVPGEEGMSLEELLDDDFRVRFLDGYIWNLMKAKSEGMDIRGYFAWSLMDNFEWANGYDKRFGLHYVNFSHPNLTRTPKSSAHWYSDYVNNVNPAAEFVSRTKAEVPMTNEEIEEMCPGGGSDTKESTGLSTGIAVLIAILVVALLLLIGYFLLKWIRKQETNRQQKIDADTTANEVLIN